MRSTVSRAAAGCRQGVENSRARLPRTAPAGPSATPPALADWQRGASCSGEHVNTFSRRISWPLGTRSPEISQTLAGRIVPPLTWLTSIWKVTGRRPSFSSIRPALLGDGSGGGGDRQVHVGRPQREDATTSAAHGGVTLGVAWVRLEGVLWPVLDVNWARGVHARECCTAPFRTCVIDLRQLRLVAVRCRQLDTAALSFTQASGAS